MCRQVGRQRQGELQFITTLRGARRGEDAIAEDACHRYASIRVRFSSDSDFSGLWEWKHKRSKLSGLRVAYQSSCPRTAAAAGCAILKTVKGRERSTTRWQELTDFCCQLWWISSLDWTSQRDLDLTTGPGPHNGTWTSQRDLDLTTGPGPHNGTWTTQRGEECPTSPSFLVYGYAIVGVN